MVQQQRLQMSVTIVFTRPVVFVSRPSWREFLQPNPDIFNQTILIIVHINCGRNMHWRYKAQTVNHAATPYYLLYLHR